jgi:hypothetical protein
MEAWKGAQRELIGAKRRELVVELKRDIFTKVENLGKKWHKGHIGGIHSTPHSQRM